MPSESEELIEPVPQDIKLSRFDGRALWRVAFWGASAAIALTVVAGTAFSDVGAERLKVALAPFIEPVKTTIDQSNVALARTEDLQRQTEQLAASLRELTADRERLKGRIAILEQNLDDITGAIKKQTADAARQPAKEPIKEAARTPATPPPVIEAPTTTAAMAPPVAEPAPTASIPAPGVPLPPARTASIPATDQPAEAAPAPVLKKELGVDLGGANTLDALRAHWSAIKANLGPDLVGMHASYLQRQKQSGAIEYRLIVGAFPNTAAALRLCGRAAAMHLTCRAGVYNVQQFAER